MWRCALLLCVGCDRLFEIIHLPASEIDAPLVADAATPDAPTICFVDGFESASIDTTHWIDYAALPASVAQTGGHLVINIGPTIAYAGVYTAAFDFTDSAIQVDLVAPPADNDQEAGIELGDSNNDYAIYITAGYMYLREHGDSVADESVLTFDPAMHRQLRIRHVNGGTAMVLFETSDGTTWTTRKTSSAQIPVTSIVANLYAGTYIEPALQTDVEFDNFTISGHCPF